MTMTSAAPPMTGNRKERMRIGDILPTLLIVPALVIVALLLVLPVVYLISLSFYDDGFTLEHYRRLASDPVYWSTFKITIEVSVAITLISIVLGYPVAYLAANTKGIWPGLILALVIIPFWTSVLVRIYAWLVLLQRRGLINNFLIEHGFITEPLSLVHNWTGTFIGTVHVMVPYMVLPLYAAMKKIPAEMQTAAYSLGASKRYAFWRVYLPLSAPGLIAGSLVVFVLCLGFYLTPEILGGGRTVMVSMLVQRNIELYQRFGAASAVALVLLLFVFFLFWLVTRVLPLERLLGGK